MSRPAPGAPADEKYESQALDLVVNLLRSGSSGGFVLGDKLDLPAPVQVSTTRLGKYCWLCHRCVLAGDSAFNVSFAGLRIILSCQLAPLRPKDAKSHPSTSARASVTGAADDFRFPAEHSTQVTSVKLRLRCGSRAGRWRSVAVCGILQRNGKRVPSNVRKWWPTSNGK
jgi:hypothetical protein